MTEKLVLTALLGALVSISTVEVVDQAKPILLQANAVVTVTQERELQTALEQYFLEYNSYPNTLDQDVATVLYENSFLESADVPFTVEYRSSRHGQEYELKVL